jgi:hypothetical protein
MTIKPMDVTPEVAAALANLRLIAQAAGTSIRLRNAINALDDAGVFAEIDERYDYAAPADVLQEIAEAEVPNTLDPAEWGDTTSADVARRQGYVPALERLSTLEYPRATPELDASDRAAEGRLGRRALGLDRRSHGSLAADND